MIDTLNLLINGWSQTFDCLQNGMWAEFGIMFAIMFIIWLTIIILIKIVVLDNIFPQLILVDNLNNTVTVGRILAPLKIKREGNKRLAKIVKDPKTGEMIKSYDNQKEIRKLSLFYKNADYIALKTHFRPLFDVQKLRVNGHNMGRWWRSLNIYTTSMHDVVWNDNNGYYDLVTNHNLLEKEEPTAYKGDIDIALKDVAYGVTHGVKGDTSLQKSKYRLSIPYDFKDDTFYQTGKQSIKVPLSVYKNMSREEKLSLEKYGDIEVVQNAGK